MERKFAGLRARRMTEADLEPLHRLLSDPEVMRYLEPPFSREQTRAFLERAGLTPEPLILAVDDDGGFAGYVIWHPYDDVSMELGWVLDRSRWGRGYAGELTRLLTDRARRQGRGVVIECVPEQTVTRHIAEKSGFRFCGIVEGCCVYRWGRTKKNRFDRPTQARQKIRMAQRKLRHSAQSGTMYPGMPES